MGHRNNNEGGPPHDHSCARSRPHAQSRTRAAPAPLPSGPAWHWFIARHPQVDQARIASRWHAAAALFAAGHVGPPDPDGTRQVLAQNYASPDRQPGDPIAYHVHTAITSPRQYACDCPDWQHRQGVDGLCKHIIAVWLALFVCCTEKQAEAAAAAILAELLTVNRDEFTRLLLAVRDRDGRAARTAAARLAGWPKRDRSGERRKQETPQPRRIQYAA